jgi:probable rRNA maturation factor
MQDNATPEHGPDGQPEDRAVADDGEPPSRTSAGVHLGLHLAESLDPDDQADADPARLRRHIDSALLHLGIVDGDLSVVVLDDEAMSAAHADHLGVDGTTDVITFDLRDEPRPDAPLDAEILICLDEARRRAAELGHETWRELLLYVVHGVLHCIGYDDHDAASHQRMHEREDEILAAIGAGVTFARNPHETCDHATDQPVPPREGGAA